MEKFLKLVSIARTEGIIDLFDAVTKNSWRLARRLDKGPFFSLVEKAHVFVFHNPEQMLLDNGWAAEKAFDFECCVPLPFEVVSYEGADGILHNHDKESIECALAKEEEPNKFVHYLLMSNTSGNYWVGYVRGGDKAETTAPIRALSLLINKKKTGIESTNQPVKTKTEHGNKIIRIRKIVHIADSDTYLKTKSIQGDPIDWSHRWEVRGHWRKTRYLGKDRNGDYRVNGHTWVTEHEKGPEDLPLIKKTRLFIPKGEQHASYGA